MPAKPSAEPLRLDVTEPAEQQIKATETWLLGLPFGGAEAAARFMDTVGRQMPELCANVAERLTSGSNLPRIDEEASLAYSRPAYRHTFTTAAGGKRKRGQTAGVYVLFYALPNANTLTVLGLRHSAAQPLTAFLDAANLFQVADATGGETDAE